MQHVAPPPPQTERVETAAPSPATPARRPRWWTAALLFVVFLVFARSLGNGFTYDDKFLTRSFYRPGTPNPMIHELQPLGTYFTSPYWKGVSKTETLYRPVSILSYALTYHLLGRHLPADLEAAAQHLVNVLLYVFSVWLVFRLLVRVTGDTWPARLGALAFGLHAIHTEAVAGIVGRAEILSLCFGALAVLSYVRARERAGTERWWRYACSGLFLFLAFGSKESALAWLPFLPVYSLATQPAEERNVRVELARALAVGVAPLALFFVLRYVALSELVAANQVAWAANPLAHEPAGVRILTATKVWAYALYKLCVPYPLASDYGARVFDQVESAFDPLFVLSLAALGLVLWLGIKSYRVRPLVFLAVTSFFGFSFLTSNVAIPIGTLFAERLLFVPSLGFAFLVTFVCRRFPPRQQLGQLVHGTLAVLMIASAGLSVHRVAAWKNDLTLFVTDAKAQPRSLQLQLNAANRLIGYGDHTGWKAYARRALRLEASYAPVWWLLARQALDHERWQRAEHYLNKGRACKRLTPRGDIPRFHLLRGELFVRRGRFTDAYDDFVAALRIRPSLFCDRLQRFDELVDGKLTREQRLAIYELGKQLAPEKPQWDLRIGLLEARSGRYQNAQQALSIALPRLPHSKLRFEARLRLAESLIHLDRGTEARRELDTLLGDTQAPPEILVQARALARRCD